MPVCVMQAAQAYLKEAENYLNGARAQGELFSGDEEEQPPP